MHRTPEGKMNEKWMVKTTDIVNHGLWKLWPVINVDRCKDIPCDYPGAMGVPITFLDKMGKNDGHSGFELLGIKRGLEAEGRKLYQRLIIRNLCPELPEEIDLIEWLNRSGVAIEIDLVDFPEVMPGEVAGE